MFLALRKGFKQHANGVVQILGQNMFTQLHPRIRLCHADDALDMTRSHWRSTTLECLCPDQLVKVCQLLFVDIRDLWEDVLPRKDDIVLQEFLVDWLDMGGLLGKLGLNQLIV